LSLWKRELDVVQKICGEIGSSGKIAPEHLAKFLKQFGDRYKNALKLVEEGCVKKYVFKPSLRVLWVVKGRKGEYQVMAETNFCSCADYYFRVIDRKKGLCYHIIAQRLAEALGKYGEENLPDSEYGRLTDKLKAKEK